MYEQDRQRIRARRSRQGGGPPVRPRRSSRGAAPSGRLVSIRRVLAVFCLAMVVAAGWFTWRSIDFFRAFNVQNPFAELGSQLHPAQGSVGWKVQNGQRVNILLLGYGGSENDAPYLTDTDMVLSIDSANHRAMMTSVPRDLLVKICAYADGRCDRDKLNVAYSTGMYDDQYPGKKPEFTANKDRGGNLAMQTMSQVSGLSFDGYVAVDFKAFRDLVDALGGVQVCLPGPLDDNQYPDGHDGYIPGGIHFKAGCQQVNGTQALQLARSRHADQPEEASDFGRIKRQQLLVNAIRKKAMSVDGIAKAPDLMHALAQDFATNLNLTDMRVLYDWSKSVPDNAIGRASVDLTNFLDDQSCGGDTYFECATDPSYQMLHTFFNNVLVDPAVLKQQAPVQIANASYSLGNMQTQVASAMGPLGLKMAPPIRVQTSSQSTVYDYSGGKYAKTAQWLATYFGAKVEDVSQGATPPTPNPPANGVVVVLGRDFSVRWVGEA
jgi:polyisoprenyl-teichoic acid--peptidoglycan teichoic acid transferase